MPAFLLAFAPFSFAAVREKRNWRPCWAARITKWWMAGPEGENRYEKYGWLKKPLTVRSIPLGRMMWRVTGLERLNCWGHHCWGPLLLATPPPTPLPPLALKSATSTSVRNFDWIKVGTLATDMLSRREMRRPRLRGASVTMALRTWYSLMMMVLFYWYFLFYLFPFNYSVSSLTSAHRCAGSGTIQQHACAPKD